MAINEIKQELSELQDNSKRLLDEYSDIDKLLHGNNTIQSNERFPDLFLLLTTQYGLDHRLYEKIRNYVKSSNSNARLIDDFFTRNHSFSLLDISNAKSVRKAERHDLWWLWLQRLCRWVLGAFVVVLLYSSFVYLAEYFDFIKIPIREFLLVKGI